MNTKETITYELDIWIKAYPRNSKLLEKFAKKLIFELWTADTKSKEKK